MRIWHKDLIQYLPKKQLKAMRYELGDMIKQYPNIKHSLVKYANNYDISYLGQYFGCVLLEFERRKLNHRLSYDNEIVTIVFQKTNLEDQDIMDNDLKFKEDDDEYFWICLVNLYEKYIRGMVSKEEWKIIEDKFGEYLK